MSGIILKCKYCNTDIFSYEELSDCIATGVLNNAKVIDSRNLYDPLGEVKNIIESTIMCICGHENVVGYENRLKIERS